MRWLRIAALLDKAGGPQRHYRTNLPALLMDMYAFAMPDLLPRALGPEGAVDNLPEMPIFDRGIVTESFLKGVKASGIDPDIQLGKVSFSGGVFRGKRTARVLGDTAAAWKVDGQDVHKALDKVRTFGVYPIGCAITEQGTWSLYSGRPDANFAKWPTLEPPLYPMSGLADFPISISTLAELGRRLTRSIDDDKGAVAALYENFADQLRDIDRAPHRRPKA